MRFRRIEPLLVALLVIAVGWTYLRDAWLSGEKHFTNKLPAGYYGLLTQAVVSGRLDVAVTIDPKFQRLENPYAGPQGTSRPHDMSYYKGKFYLYYGLTPVLILLAPWHLVTGTYLMEVTAVACFCFGGFLLATWWLLRVRRRLFPEINPIWPLLAVAVMGFGSPTFALSDNNTFYAVPVSAAVVCLMAALLCADHACAGRSWSRALGWMAAASLCGGLAVGARPNYVLGLSALLIPAYSIWTAQSPDRRNRRTLLQIAFAAIIPAAIIGVGIAVYNYLRFENPFDFGIRFSLATEDLRNAKLMGPQFIAKNLRIYLLHPTPLLRYYPFFYSDGYPFGVLPHLTLAVAALFFPLALRSARLRNDARFRNVGWMLLWSALANLTVLCFFFGGVDRYLNDFVPPALLLGCTLLLAAADRTTPRSGRRIIGLLLLTLAAAWTLWNGLCFGLANRVPSPFWQHVEHAANRVAYRAEQITGTRYGPLELELTFPTHATGSVDPLLSTGNLGGTGDIVTVKYLDDHHIQLGYFHIGAGGPTSEPIAIDYAQPHRVAIKLGSLYPPRQHPMFAALSDAQYARLNRQLEISIDGRVALRRAVDVYPSNAGGVLIGENRAASDVSRRHFEGKITAERRLPIPQLPAPEPLRGAVELHVQFPTNAAGTTLPLVSTGHTGAGDLIAVQMLAGGKIKFLHDSWGYVPFVSDPITLAPQSEHIVTVATGALHTGISEPGSDAASRLSIWLDGHPVVDEPRPFSPTTADEVEFGYNALHASTSVAAFSGEVLSTRSLPPPLHPAAPAVWGAVRLNVHFPSDVPGRSEPLVVTGTTGAADLIYVVYEDAGHIRIGHEHWGAAAVLSPPLAIDYARPHNVEISMGSVLPPEGNAAWNGRSSDIQRALRQTVSVRLDGQEVFTERKETFAPWHGRAAIGRNDVSASSCAREFTGEILARDRAPLP